MSCKVCSEHKQPQPISKHVVTRLRYRSWHSNEHRKPLRFQQTATNHDRNVNRVANKLLFYTLKSALPTHNLDTSEKNKQTSALTHLSKQHKVQAPRSNKTKTAKFRNAKLEKTPTTTKSSRHWQTLFLLKELGLLFSHTTNPNLRRVFFHCFLFVLGEPSLFWAPHFFC